MTVGTKAGAVVVYAVTALLLAAAVIANLVWVKNIGIQEDWLMVGQWTGTESDLPGWLWSLNNGHRTPLPRMIYLALLWLTNDFRSGAFLNQFLMAGLALLLACSAAAARGGGLRVIDAVFPLALLHLGNWHNIEWGWQIQFVATTCLGGLLLCAITPRPAPSRWACLLAVVAIALLPMTGLPGIIIAVGMIPWLAVTAFIAPKRSGDRVIPWLMLGTIVFVLVYTTFYFVGWQSEWSPEHPDLNRLIEASFEYFALAKGSPFLHALDRAFGVAVVALSIYTAVVCLRAWLADRGDLRAFALANFIAANGALGVSIAWSRGTFYSYFMSSSYAVFAVLPFFASLIALQLYTRHAFGRGLLYAAPALLLLILPLNVLGGFEWRDWYLSGVEKYEADVASGMSVPDIAERNTSFLLHGCDGCLLPKLRALRDAGVSPYDQLPAD